MVGTSAPRQVVLLITDTTRWDMLGCYRDTGVLTPHLDRLADSGARFRGYTCQPVCAPARAALMTGTWPHSNGVWGNNLAPGLGLPTLGQRAQAAGISAGYIGKWHLDGSDYFGTGRCPEGWQAEYWYDGRRHLEELSDEDRRRSRSYATNKDDVAAEWTYASRCSDRAVDFLVEHADRDFLLVVSYDEPHGPSISPFSYQRAYDDHVFPTGDNVRDSLDDKPEHHRLWAGDEALAADRSSYTATDPEFFASQTFVDGQIRRVLDVIDERCPDALVLYTSDHGEALGSHRLEGKGAAMYDEIARVPFLLRWPGMVEPGAKPEQPVSHIDVAPTILTALGLPVPEIMPGKSLGRYFTEPFDDPDPVFMEFGRFEVDHDGYGGFQPIRAVTDGRFKLVINLLTTDELYDLRDDPGEMQNLIGSAAHEVVRTRLHDLILDWMHDTRDPFRGYYWARRPWRADPPDAGWEGRGMTRHRPDDGVSPPVLDYGTGQPPPERVHPL
jgi:uncharacterized sulfatase